jgi:hypothetical protein
MVLFNTSYISNFLYYFYTNLFISIFNILIYNNNNNNNSIYFIFLAVLKLGLGPCFFKKDFRSRLLENGNCCLLLHTYLDVTP